MRKIIVSAPGKIHLSGEHSVVYGQPAILSAIDKRLFITLKQRKDKLVKTKDDLIKFGLEKIYQLLKRKLQSGFDLEIKSEIPVGSGLGSSAALAVALTGAIFKLEELKWDENLVNKIAYQIEKKQHGNPSGGDNTIACFGGLLKFQKKKAKFSFEQLKPKSDLPQFLLVDTGRPIETTGEMVTLVRSKINPPAGGQKLIQDIGKITRKVIAGFDKNQFSNLKDLISENERLLEQLGVVGEKAKKIIRLIEKNGGAGKICGAGGVKRGSGMVLVYNPEIKKIIRVLDSHGLDYSRIKLGQEGVRVEK